MTIRKNEVWGREMPCPDGVVAVDGDTAAAAVVGRALRDGVAPPVVALLGGDLARTCGSRRTAAPEPGEPVQALPLDICSVLVDGEVRHFVAHLVARRSWWRGPVTVLMNAQYIGAWDVAPRSHPNDGRVDLLRGDLALGDRLKARGRLRSGTHVPHPDIEQRRVTGLQLDLAAGTRVWLDGEAHGGARALSVRVIPDAWTAVI